MTSRRSRSTQSTGRLALLVNAQVSSATGTPLPYFPVPANPIDISLTGATLFTLSGTPATGDVVFPYAYNSATGQLTISQNSAAAHRSDAGHSNCGCQRRQRFTCWITSRSQFSRGTPATSRPERI